MVHFADGEDVCQNQIIYVELKINNIYISFAC